MTSLLFVFWFWVGSRRIATLAVDEVGPVALDFGCAKLAIQDFIVNID